MRPGHLSLSAQSSLKAAFDFPIMQTMTAIACYVQREHTDRHPETREPFVWAVADSRVSNPGEFGGNQILNDRATKIFSVSYLVRTGTGAGRVVGAGSFGYCYSGSSITGLNTHALLSHLFRNLQGPELPRFADIVEFVRSTLHRYVLEYAFIAAEKAACECAVLGFCPVERTPQIYVLRPDTTTGSFQYRIEILDVATDGNYALLGDEKARVGQLIDEAHARYSPGSINWWRAPWHGIQAAISSNQFASIGGHVQLGIGGRGEFQVFGRMEAEAGGSGYEFLGIDTGASLGPCKLGIPYMKGLAAFQEPHHK